MFGGGVYHYVSGALGNVDVRGEQLAAAVLPGWRFIRDGFIVTVFLGYDFQSHQLTPDDPSAGLRGDYVGARTGFELWYEPSATTMVAADASVSTIGPSYSARLATGWRSFDLFYLGPEVAGLRRRRQLPPVPRRLARHRIPDRHHSNGRPASAGPTTPTTAAAPTASSACSRGAESVSRACGGSASPRSIMATSIRPASASVS